MIKNDNELLRDMNYRNSCTKYGIPWDNPRVFEDMIILDTPKKNIFVLEDEHYNTIGIYEKIDKLNEIMTVSERLRYYKQNYKSTRDKLVYPFQRTSLSQLVRLSNRVSYLGNNIIVNGEILKDGKNSQHIKVLLYMSFLGGQVEQYFKNLYQMKMMGFDYPDVFTYVNKTINDVNECIDKCIKEKRRPWPVDIINYLGQDPKNVSKYEHELYAIIELLLSQKGAKIGNGFDHYDEISLTDKDTTNLTNISIELLKILDVSDDEIEARYEEINEDFKINEVSLQSLLAGSKESSVRSKK